MPALLDGKYKIIGELGRGGFGRVQLAEDVIAERKVAIKVLHERESDIQNLITKEMRVIASLNHQNIITFYHTFTHNNKLHLVMQYCSYGNLSEYVGNIDEDNIHNLACEIGIKIASALEYAHEKDIVHHDVKPANILFDDELNLKVSDFGIANTLWGTRSYTPPELYMNIDGLELDPKVDIYSLGVTLLEIVLGTNPLTQFESLEEQFSQKLNQEFIPSTLPIWFTDIILKATHPNRLLRFQSMKEFKNALTSRSIPVEFNISLFRANKIALSASNYLKRKRWSKSIQYVEKALEINSKSVLALQTGGNYYLKINELEKAAEYFEKALRSNPRIDIQKELATIKLLEGNYSRALFFLNDYLQRYPNDKEAYSLLVETLFYIQRYEEATEVLLDLVQKIKEEHFLANLLIISMMTDIPSFEDLKVRYASKINYNPFISYNIWLTRNLDEIVSSDQQIKSKMLYEAYRFKNHSKQNTIKLEINDQDILTFDKNIITVGRADSCDLTFDNKRCSRLHCVILNFPKDVWILDLSSNGELYVEHNKVNKRMFLLGKKEITIGDSSFTLYTDTEFLI